MIVGLCGGSGAGKTTIIEMVKEHFPGQVSVIDMDNLVSLPLKMAPFITVAALLMLSSQTVLLPLELLLFLIAMI